MKRDVQGKFALKNEDYRLVRSLRLTDTTWQVLGIASECLGLTRADYLEQIIRDNTLPSITRKVENNHPCNTRYEEEIEILKAEIRSAESRECCVDGTSKNYVSSSNGS